MTSFFEGIQLGPPIEVFALSKAYQDDVHDCKVNLTVGAYRNNEGKPWVLPVVQKVEIQMASDLTLDHEYLPVIGLASFSSAATKLLLGPESPAIKEERVVGVQSLSGTGALRLAAEFLHRILHFDTFYYSNPTWENHKLVFFNGGFTKNVEYRYLDSKNNCIDFDGMIEDLRNAPKNVAVILQACAHNPTGYDPTREQWKEIANVVIEKHLFVVFDCAYQGFASGNPDNDAFAVRLFVSRGIEFIVTQSFAKNFGLYNERAGNVVVVANSSDHIAEIRSQFTLLARAQYSNPPNHGARVVSIILNDPELTEQWKANIRTMSGRIREMRKALCQRLKDLKTPGSWDHIVKQIGMFSYTGLNEKQVHNLVKKYHIYLLRSGRINMSGLNDKNLDYVAQAIYDTVTTIK